MSTPMTKLDYPGMPPEIFCPACGRAVCTENPPESFCEHVCLIHTDAGGDIEWVKDGLKEAWEAKMRQRAEEESVVLDTDYELDDYVFELDWDVVYQSLCDAVKSPSAFGLQIGTYQMPNAFSSLIVFDFNPGAAE